MARRITPRLRAASRQTIRKAQMARVRSKEPRQIGRIRPLRRGQSLRTR